MITFVMVALSASVFAEVNHAEMNESRNRGARYEAQADWRLYFENWDKLGIIGAPFTNGAVITAHTTQVKSIADALAQAIEKKDLAVIIVSHRFLNHYSKDDGERQLDVLSEKIRQAGFKRVVFLSETQVGNLPRRE